MQTAVNSAEGPLQLGPGPLEQALLPRKRSSIDGLLGSFSSLEPADQHQATAQANAETSEESSGEGSDDASLRVPTHEGAAR